MTGEISLTSKKNLLKSDCLGEVNILELLLIHDTMCKVASKKNEPQKRKHQSYKVHKQDREELEEIETDGISLNAPFLCSHFFLTKLLSKVRVYLISHYKCFSYLVQFFGKVGC